MKRLLLLFLSLFITFSVFSETVMVDGVEYSIIKKAQLASVHKTDRRADIVIPSTIIYDDVTYDVVAIDEYAFDVNGMDVHYGNVTLPNTIKNIGKNAFGHCIIDTLRIPDLSFYCKICFEIDYWDHDACPLSFTKHLYVNGEEVNNLIIPNDVDSISAYAFWNAKPIISVTIPNSVKSIGKEAFHYCRSIGNVEVQGATIISESAFAECDFLKTISFNENVSIEASAFAGCKMLESINGDSNIIKMGGSIFYGCVNLKNFTFSKEIEKIEPYLFNGCRSLSSITIPNSCTSIGSGSFKDCTSLTSITIPNSCTLVGSEAFAGCSKLVEVVIGTGISKIESRSFSNCSELNDVYIYSKNVPQANNDIFDDSYVEYTTLHVRESAINSFKDVSPWNSFKEIVKIDIPKHTIKYLVDGEVYKSYEIEEGESVTPEPAPTKKGYTFSGWSDIPSTMPANDVTVTGTFSINKYKLTYMVDGAEYKSYDIEYGATITPEAAPTKEGYTFSGWSEIPETMPANDVTVTGTFSLNKYKLTYVVDGAEYKSYDVDYGAAITPEPEPTKDGYTFSGWSEIPSTMPAKDVTITGSFSAIVIDEDTGEFTATSGSTVELTNDNNVSGEYGIPETITYNGVTYTVTSIGNGAFENNTNLTDVTIPSTITSIGESAFYECI